jgi:predicted dehydrogenase
MSPLRIGIVGARFAAELHATNYRPLRPARAELTAVCSRTREEAERFARRHAIPRVFTDYHALAASPDVDVVDICTTTDMHHEIAVVAARAGKHVIVEKPLTGAFRDATEPRDAMLATALANADAVLDAVAKAGVTLCYGEDFVWSHPVGAVLHLKHWEGLRRRGRPVRVRAVSAEVASLTRLPVVSGIRRHMSTLAEDVEDWSVAVLTFEDGTMATIHSNDITLGGVRNVVTAYLTNAVIQANINPNTAVMAYAPDAAVWGDEYITEKVETKAGWQYPSPDEDWMRGYPQELDDFVSAISDGREPLSGALLAREVVEVIYAGYLSAATGRRVELPRP